MTPFLVNWQKAEGALVLIAGLSLYYTLGSPFAWWAAVLWFFAPDLSFAGYALGPRIGAYAYNAVHIYGFGAAVLALGLAFSLPIVTALGALWLAHSGLDRAVGYGLKSDSSFKDTHLGPIGHN